jgi:ABC-type polysaccharide/polyol phosphate transport system ATPase subunit
MLTESKTLQNTGMDNKTVIHLENVSVVYRLPRDRLSGLKEYTIRFLQRRLEYHEFWALRDVSFDVQKGEVFGVIGRNGAGKSTLLKVIAKVLFPTQGRVVMRGRVAPLLEVGAGFQPELTGRENVFLNSTLLGRSHKETEHLLPAILEFAELEDFIDAPLRTFSTGMVARLGFSVATCVRPEILLVDEVLSVGDAQFQQKCIDRMYSFLDQGTTVVIVSHGMGTIESICDRALWLHNGRVEAYGTAEEVARQYVQRFRVQPKEDKVSEAAEPFPDESDLVIEEPAVSQTAAKPKLSLPPVPPGPTEPIWSEARDYITYPDQEAIYPAEETLEVRHGSLIAWVRFRSDEYLWGGMIFHTDDSRYVVYTSGQYPQPDSQPIPMVTARAGGNRRVIDTFYGSANFPEVTVKLDEITLDTWHLLCLTWQGYPEGRLQLYCDGNLVGETIYDRRHDNHYRLANQIAIGYRPQEWLGELVQNEDGTLVESRPETTASVRNSGMELHSVRLYNRLLTVQEIQALLTERP